MKINRENCMTANNFIHTKIKNAKGEPAKGRRNGKTQTWKTRPNDFKIPCKHGLYDYFYITQDNCEDFEIVN